MGFTLFDRYSLLHYAIGIVAYFLGLNFVEWFFIHLVFEIIENSQPGIKYIDKYFGFWPGGKSHPDAFINSAGDQISAMMGWLIAYFFDRFYYKYKNRSPIF